MSHIVDGMMVYGVQSLALVVFVAAALNARGNCSTQL